jgi:cell division protein FtsI (penicillin-binding protein 3)
LLLICGVLFALVHGIPVFCVLVTRAFYVQVVNKDFLQNKANANILRTEQLKAMRGVISDRHGVPLAISTPIMKVVIDPRDYFELNNMKRFRKKLKKTRKCVV